MTSHLDDGTLQELLDGEIPSAQLPPLQAHLAACAACRVRLEAARDVAANADVLIEALDAPPAERTASVPTIPRSTGARPWSRSLAWAASIAVAVAAGWYARGDVERVLPPSSPATTAVTEPIAAVPPPATPVAVADEPPVVAERRAAAPPATPPSRELAAPTQVAAAPSAVANAATADAAAKAALAERSEAVTAAAPTGGGLAVGVATERARRDTELLRRDLVATRQLVGASAMSDTLAIRIATVRWLADSTDLIRSPALSATCVAFSAATTVGDRPTDSSGDVDLTSDLLALLPSAARPWRPASACGIDTQRTELPSIELVTGRPALQLLVGAPRLGSPERATIGMQHRVQGRGGGGHRCEVERRDGAWVVLRCRATWAS